MGSSGRQLLRSAFNPLRTPAPSQGQPPSVLDLRQAADPTALARVEPVSTPMKNPYQGLSSGDRKIVALIATAIANGNLLPHNRHSPLAARRVFEALKDACIMQCEEDRLN